MDNEMIERVAKALFEHASLGHIINKAEYAEIKERNGLMWKESAKIAIKAMREPTNKILSVSVGSIHWSSEEVWQMYIDVILND